MTVAHHPATRQEGASRAGVSDGGCARSAQRLPPPPPRGFSSIAKAIVRLSGRPCRCTVLRWSRLTGDQESARRASPTSPIQKCSRRSHPGRTMASTTSATTLSVHPARAAARPRSARRTVRLRPQSKERLAAEPRGRLASEGYVGPARTAAAAAPTPGTEAGGKPQSVSAPAALSHHCPSGTSGETQNMLHLVAFNAARQCQVFPATTHAVVVAMSPHDPAL